MYNNEPVMCPWCGNELKFNAGQSVTDDSLYLAWFYCKKCGCDSSIFKGNTIEQATEKAYAAAQRIIERDKLLADFRDHVKKMSAEELKESISRAEKLTRGCNDDCWCINEEDEEYDNV